MGCLSSKESKVKIKSLTECVKGDYAILNLYDYETEAKVVDVYDGDSIQVVFEYKDGQRLNVKVRMYGYDAPKLKRPKNEVDRVEKKKEAIKIRDDLREIIENEMVTIQFKAWDKYGRIKAIVKHNGTNVNRWMLDTGKGDPVDKEQFE